MALGEGPCQRANRRVSSEDADLAPTAFCPHPEPERSSGLAVSRSGGAGGCGPPSFLGQAPARTMPLGKSATVTSVMTVTAWSADLCFSWLQGGTQMFELHTFESLRRPAVVEERNERPLLAALFAVIIGWSITGLIALA